MRQRPLTCLEYAILGLVSQGPMSGYDVRGVFASTPLEHFSSSPGAIYPALKRLAERGLLEAKLDTTIEARPRRVYSLSAAGLAALREWLRQPVTREELVRGGGTPMLRFSLAAGHLTATEIISYLEGCGAVVQAYLEELYEWRRRIADEASVYVRLSLESGIRGYEASLEWIRLAIREIAAAEGR